MVLHAPYNLVVPVGPGLAQLVERLAHRYSESTSLNPGNLTSATVRGDRTGCASAAKRLASVAPEVDLGECALHLPPQKANKAEPTLALNPRGNATRNPKQGYQWPQKRTCVSTKNFFKKTSWYQVLDRGLISSTVVEMLSMSSQINYMYLLQLRCKIGTWQMLQSPDPRCSKNGPS